MSLHTSVGPSRTSLSAVAERAGVSRPTVYRHFPDLPSLFAACTAHGQAADPMPDPSAWSALAGPEDRLLRGLTDLYRHFRRNQRINLHMARDLDAATLLDQLAEAPSVAAGPHPESRVFRLLARMRPMMEARNRMVLETLMAPWQDAGRATPEMEAALAVVVRFDTWRTLALEQRSEDETAARIGAAMVAALAR